MPARCAGFTLLELLAVVVIVAVLASLLSTALNQAKGRAQQIGCLNNLRQLGQAWILYADENEDELPLNHSTASSNEKLFGRRNTPDSWVAGNPKEDTSTENIETAALFPYVKSTSMYRCPGDTEKVLVKRSMRRTRSYSMSAYLSGDETGLDARVKTKLAEVQIQPAARVFVFIEEDLTSPWLGSFVVLPRDGITLDSVSFTSVPGSWHNSGSDLSFADGHVEYWRWFSKRKIGKAGSPSLTKHGIQDLRRLQEAIPKP